jgi:hypothetical protein
MVNAGHLREHEQLSVAARSTAAMPMPSLRQRQTARRRQDRADRRRHS